MTGGIKPGVACCRLVLDTFSPGGRGHVSARARSTSIRDDSLGAALPRGSWRGPRSGRALRRGTGTSRATSRVTCSRLTYFNTPESKAFEVVEGPPSTADPLAGMSLLPVLEIETQRVPHAPNSRTITIMQP
jgi:hypothetical protein